MGWTWEVLSWRRVGDSIFIYDDFVEYQGQSLIHALLAARRAKKSCGLVKVHWR